MKKYLWPLLLLAVLRCHAQSGAEGPDRGILMGYFENQQYGRAADYLLSIYKGDSVGLQGLSLLGYTYYMDNQLMQAATFYRRMFALDSANITACNYLGKINLLNGDKKRALHFFCHLVALKPGVSGYYKQLAVLWDQLGNNGAAAYYYRLSYDLNPHDPDVVSSLAGHWIMQQLYRRADSVLDISLEQDSMQAKVIETRVWSAYEQDSYRDIFPLVARLKRMGYIEQNPFLYAAIGYYYTSQYGKCVETCDFMISHKLKSRPVLYLEAMAFKQQKKYSLSLAMLNECIGLAINRDADNYYSAKGDIYESLRQYHNAIRQYDTAYYIFKSPLQLYNKARIYDARLKSPKTALRYYRLYLHHRHGVPGNQEKDVLRYTKDRVKALAAWQKEEAAR
ncbi:MAG TPA: hypothetical protein VFX43_15215 [Chitinophagaceae bacterium]|nr:hypothetical protein [Chitinophagaceae bacterium]